MLTIKYTVTDRFGNMFTIEGTKSTTHAENGNNHLNIFFNTDRIAHFINYNSYIISGLYNDLDTKH